MSTGQKDKPEFEDREFTAVGNCDNFYCPQIARQNGRVAVRSSMSPNNVAVFTDKEWAHMVAAIRSGEVG